MSDINATQVKSKEQMINETLEAGIFTPFEVKHGDLSEYEGTRVDSKKLIEEKNILDLVDRQDLALELDMKTMQRARAMGGRVSAQLVLNNQ